MGISGYDEFSCAYLINVEKSRFYFPTCVNLSQMNYIHGGAMFGTTISTLI